MHNELREVRSSSGPSLCGTEAVRDSRFSHPQMTRDFRLGKKSSGKDFREWQLLCISNDSSCYRISTCQQLSICNVHIGSSWKQSGKLLIVFHDGNYLYLPNPKSICQDFSCTWSLPSLHLCNQPHALLSGSAKNLLDVIVLLIYQLKKACSLPTTKLLDFWSRLSLFICNGIPSKLAPMMSRCSKFTRQCIFLGSFVRLVRLATLVFVSRIRSH